MDFGSRMLSMTRLSTDDFTSVFTAIDSARKLYSTRFIREMRGSVFKLAERIDPTSKIVVSGVDNVLNDLGPDEKVVIGIATSPRGIGIPLSPEDIIKDVVLDCLHYDDKFIVENYLNRFVRSAPNSMPIFKYIRFLGADEIGADVLKLSRTVTSLDAFRTNTIRKHFEKQRAKLGSDISINGILERYPDKEPFPFIPYLEEDEIDIDSLESVLKAALSTSEGQDYDHNAMLKNSDYRKCVRIYDFLRYGK